jgi:hypothetical protein
MKKLVTLALMAVLAGGMVVTAVGCGPATTGTKK